MNKEKFVIESSSQILIKEEKQKKGKIRKILYTTGGAISLILAVLGIIIPGLPCTPFALLSAALFAKGSDKLYRWILNNRFLGPRIKNYQKHRGVSRKNKLQILVLMWTMVLISTFLIIKLITLKIIVLSAGVVGAIVVWFFVPDGKEENAD